MNAMPMPIGDALFRDAIAVAADRGSDRGAALQKTRPARARPSPGAALSEDWTGAAAGSTVWLILLLYAASQGFG